VPPCFMVCRCEPLRSSGYGHMADGIGPEQAVHRTACSGFRWPSSSGKEPAGLAWKMTCEPTVRPARGPQDRVWVFAGVMVLAHEAHARRALLPFPVSLLGCWLAARRGAGGQSAALRTSKHGMAARPVRQALHQQAAIRSLAAPGTLAGAGPGPKGAPAGPSVGRVSQGQCHGLGSLDFRIPASRVAQSSSCRPCKGRGLTRSRRKGGSRKDMTVCGQRWGWSGRRLGSVVDLGQDGAVFVESGHLEG
jgi:hypothetical protein